MKTRILIICDGNNCLSQIAEAYLKSFDYRLDVISAGTEPTGQIDQLAIRVMKEAGIDISGRETKSVNQFVSIPFDYVITLSNTANKNCPQFESTIKNRWHLAYNDPSKVDGSEEKLLNIYRQIRDDIHTGFLSFYKTQIQGDHECDCCSCN